MGIIGWSSGVTVRNRFTCVLMTADCIILRRLASHIRLCGLDDEFSAHSSSISKIFCEVAKKFNTERRALVTTLCKNLNSERAKNYAEFIHRTGSPLGSCTGFLDDAKILIAGLGGPSCSQRCMYSGHSRCHCLTYQTVSTSDGLIMNPHGPVESRRSDGFIFKLSKLGIQMEEKFVTAGKLYCIYGDQAYVLRPWVYTSCSRPTATGTHLVYKILMNAARVSVEHSHGEVKTHFTTMYFKSRVKLSAEPKGMLYVCSVPLLNIETYVMHLGLVARRFDCIPPSLKRY